MSRPKASEEKIKYKALYNRIADQIDTRDIWIGEKLSSESELCAEYQISRQTVRNALEALERNGYITRVKGKGTFVKKEVVFNRTKTIGVCLSFMENYIFPEVLQGIEEVLAREGYGVDLRFGHNRVNNEKDFLQRVISLNLSGVIIEGIKSAFPNPNIKYYNELIRKKIPIIFVNNHYQNLDCNGIELDDNNLMYETTRLLIEAGHRKIGGLFKSDDHQGHQRYFGFVRALLDHDVEVDESHIYWYDTANLAASNLRNAVIFDNFARIIAENCTAVAFYNDLVAVQIIKRLRDLGKQVPEDISVIGFDHSDITKSIGLKIVSANHPKHKLGKKAAEMLVELINDPKKLSSGFTIYRYPTEIIPGNSIKQI